MYFESQETLPRYILQFCYYILLMYFESQETLPRYILQFCYYIQYQFKDIKSINEFITSILYEII